MKAVRFLSAVRREPVSAEENGYPFTLPLIRDFERLAFPSAVTFFAGENGSGKSTLLEALAAASGAVAAGSHDIRQDPTMSGPRRLARALVLERGARAATRLFVRAEDVFGFASRVELEMRGFLEQEEAMDADGPIAPGSGRARMRAALRGSRQALEGRYGEDPHARSHGELFLQLLQQRLVPRGLYFLDEPETPLSPTRVLALIATILGCVRAGSQFVIATHSPLLMAVPDATIYVFAEGRIRAVAYDDVEHVALTRSFLQSPERYLRHLAD